MAWVIPKDRGLATAGSNPVASLAQDSSQFTFGVGGLGSDVYSYDDFLDMRRAGRDRQDDGSVRLPRIRPPKPKKPWVSPPEFGGTDYDVETVVRYQFARPQSINYVYFEVANVPCNWTVWVLDEGQGDFIPLTDNKGSRVRGTLLGVRTEISTGRTQQSSLEEFLNPESVGFGNFVPYEFSLPKITTGAVEFRMDRKIPADLLPRYSSDGDVKVAYSLALRGLRFSHLLEREDDLPLDDEEVVFTDPVGGRQRLAKSYQSSHYASDRDLDSDWRRTFWQSGPQPIAGAVVPLYMDISDPATGEAVAVDRLSTVPIWPGPNFNVYWSNDDKVGDFYLSHKTSSATLLGGATQERTFGLLCGADESRAEFDAVPMRLDLRQDWAVGCVYVPAYNSSDDLADLRYVWEFELADGKRLGLRYSPDGEAFSVVWDGTVVYTSPQFSFSIGDSVAVSVGFNHGESDQGWWFHADLVAPAAPDEPDEDTRRWSVALDSFGSGDSFSLTWGGEEVGPFSHNASGSTTASAIQTALEGLDAVGGGNVSVTASSASLFTVDFDDAVDADDLAVGTTTGCTAAVALVPLEDGETWDNQASSAPGIAALPSVLAVGNRVGGDAVVGGTTLRSADGAVRQFWVRQDAFALPYARAFSNRPYNFVNGVGPKDRNNGFYRCVFKASFWRDTTARFGPGAGWFDAKEWVPVPRDFVLRNGIHHLPPIVAKHVKLEFYNLVAQPYEARSLRYGGGSAAQVTFNYWPRTVTEYHRRARGKSQPRERIRQRFPLFGDDPTQAAQVARGIRRQRVGDRQTREFLESGGQRFDDGRVIYKPGSLPPALYRAWARGDAVNQREIVDALEEVALTKSFYLVGPHQYETEVVPLAGNEAYFVGLKDVSVYRSDATLDEDTPEYVDLLTDEARIDPDPARSHGYELLPDGGVLFTQKGGQFETLTLPSISLVRTIQLAARQTDWDTTLSDGQLSLVTTDHLETVKAGTTTTTVTGEYGGSGSGNLLRVAGTGSGYGIRTKAGLFDALALGGANPDAYYDASTYTYDDAVSYDDTTRFYDLSGARTSAAVRFYLPDTAEGSYELRLYTVLDGAYRLVAKTEFSPPAREWGEYEVAYMARPGETNWVAEVVQTDATVSERFVVDMLGIWQSPIRWEVSNDDGATWQQVLTALNDPDGFVSFPVADRKLRLRAVALRADVSVYAWHLVPWYLESPVARRVPMDYAPPWGVSDRQDLRAVIHRPMFQGWTRSFPRRYSLDQLGTVPTDGQGFTP